MWILAVPTCMAVIAVFGYNQVSVLLYSSLPCPPSSVASVSLSFVLPPPLPPPIALSFPPSFPSFL